MKSTAPTVTTTATVIASGAAGTAHYPCAVGIQVPEGGQTVYVGGPDVTSSNGWAVAAGTEFFIDVAGEDVYGIVAATTQAVRVLRRGV